MRMNRSKHAAESQIGHPVAAVVVQTVAFTPSPTHLKNGSHSIFREEF
jgi:hypothetical protein